MSIGRSNLLAKLTAIAFAAIMAGGAAAQAQDYSEDQVAAFANALMEVQTIRKGMKGELQQAEDKAERTAIRKEAQRDMRRAIKDEGLTMDEYDAMAQTLRQNDDFWKRVQMHFAD